MAVTILQQPNAYELAVGLNIWTLTGISSTANRYALRVWRQVTSSTVEIVATYKQAPNPAGNGIFDVSQILQSYLGGMEDSSVEIQEILPYGLNEAYRSMRYYVQYGEQTGDAEPEWRPTASDVKTVFDGYKPFYELNWVDWDRYIVTMDEYLCEGAGESTYSSCPVAEGQFLQSFPQTRDYTDVSGIPERNVSLDTWMTVSYADFHENSWTSLDNFNKRPWGMKIEFFNASNTLYDTRYWSFQYPNCFTDTPWTWTPWALMRAIGVGPMNLKRTLGGFAVPMWPATDPDHYRVTLFTKNCNLGTDCTDVVDLAESEGCVWYQASFNMVENCSPFEPIQFSFLNEFGATDYYTFTKRNTYTEQTQRNNWFRDAGSWSSGAFLIRDTERGTKTFNSTVTGSMLVSTDWIGNEEAAWLEKLYTSPFTQAYIDGRWLAVNITSNTYEQKTVARNNKMFRYELTFDFSQPQQRQRG
jgi:hypothetical protein